MNISTAIVLGIVAILLAFAIVYLVRQRKKGGCSGCSSCPSSDSCSSAKPHQ